MSVDSANPNHLAASVTAVVAVVDVAIAQLVLPALLAKNQNAMQTQIIYSVLYAAAALMLILSFYFSYAQPIK
ncbi:MAG: hypothetical protein KGI29_05470 [Pseudomonadota bacterium]|nr:hypothetical protein [Pseudomonadota bacterium]MDE3037511.1 hypothetical protein [Pseudomonadota bacterium]